MLKFKLHSIKTDTVGNEISERRYHLISEESLCVPSELFEPHPLPEILDKDSMIKIFREIHNNPRSIMDTVDLVIHIRVDIKTSEIKGKDEYESKQYIEKKAEQYLTQGKFLLIPENRLPPEDIFPFLTRKTIFLEYKGDVDEKLKCLGKEDLGRFLRMMYIIYDEDELL